MSLAFLECRENMDRPLYPTISNDSEDRESPGSPYHPGFVDDMREIHEIMEKECASRTTMCRADNGMLVSKTPDSSQDSNVSEWNYSQRDPVDIAPLASVVNFIYCNLDSKFIRNHAVGVGKEGKKSDVVLALGQDPENLRKLLGLALEAYDSALAAPPPVPKFQSAVVAAVNESERAWDELEKEYNRLQAGCLELEEKRDYEGLYERSLKKADITKKMSMMVTRFNANCLGASNFEGDPEHKEKLEDEIGMLVMVTNQLDMALKTIHKDKNGVVKDYKLAWESIDFVTRDVSFFSRLI